MRGAWDAVAGQPYLAMFARDLEFGTDDSAQTGELRCRQNDILWAHGGRPSREVD
jgi:hypothetical protein